MYGNDRKKILILYVLSVLKEHSDCDHHLTQQKILELLGSEYGVTCDRRSVKANVEALIDFGYDIGMDKGYYLASREFEDAELRMLIDSILFSRHITETQGKRLIEKLERQSNEYFRNSVSHVRTLPNLYHTANKQVLYVLDALNTAIGRHKKVQFTYNSYGTDFKLHPRKDEPYIVNPYQMVANNGFYYLIGNMDKYDNLIHFRIDRITDVDVLDTRSRSMRELKGMEKGFNLPKHMAEHIYMFCGETVRVTLKTEISMMDNLVDWFGNSFTILNKDEKDNSMKISVNCNYNAMFYWALQFGMHAEVLSPDKLRKEISDALQKIAGKYST